MREDEVDTPALLLDLDAFEHNLARMQPLLAPTGAKLRAHAKTHKSPVIAHRQIAAGAIGQCVQKVGEAEVLAWGGVADILVSNEVVGDAKLARFAALARIAQVAICADDDGQCRPSRGSRRSSRRAPCRAGRNRCRHERAAACRPGRRGRRLAQMIAGSQHLRFAGLQAYHGRAQHFRTPEERESGDRRRGRRRAPHGRAAAPAGARLRRSSAAPAPARSSSRRRAASITRSRPAATASWTPTTRRNQRRRLRRFPARAVRAGDRHERGPARPRGARRRAQGGRDRQRHAAGLGPRGRRATPARPTSTASSNGTDGAGATRREAAAGARPLRPDGGPVRLVCRRARRPGRMPVAGCGPGRVQLRCGRASEYEPGQRVRHPGAAGLGRGPGPVGGRRRG